MNNETQIVVSIEVRVTFFNYLEKEPNGTTWQMSGYEWQATKLEPAVERKPVRILLTFATSRYEYRRPKLLQLRLKTSINTIQWNTS